MDKEKLKLFLKERENFFLILLVVFTVLFRFYYFLKLGNQPIWWDEGDYLAISKVWALGQETPVWWGHFTGMRPLLMPIIWAGFFKFGLDELSIRFFTLLLPSLIVIYLTYLLGKDLYDKKIGLIAGVMMSVYWVFFFYSFRLLTDIPSVFFGMLSFYFFWGGYLKKQKNKGLYFAILFGVFAFSARFPLALVLITCFFYLFFIRKFSIFKDKVIWKSLGLLILFLSPYLIYFISTKFYLFQFYFGESAVSMKQPIAWYIIPMVGSFLHSFWLVSFLVGIITLTPLIFGFDIFWKRKNNLLDADFFVVLWLVIHLIFYIIIFKAANDRWLLMMMPPIFFIASKGIIFVYDKTKEYSKELAMVFLVILLFGGAYQNLQHSIDLTEIKKTTYNEVK